jgi:hypothetical protein
MGERSRMATDAGRRTTPWLGWVMATLAFATMAASLRTSLLPWWVDEDVDEA